MLGCAVHHASQNYLCLCVSGLTSMEATCCLPLRSLWGSAPDQTWQLLLLSPCKVYGSCAVLRSHTHTYVITIHCMRGTRSHWVTHSTWSFQVVDIISTWRSLGPELSCDSRPLVVKAITELLALVPQLTVKSEEYEVHEKQRTKKTVIYNDFL